MKLAAQLRKAGLSLAAALKRAWAVIRVKSQLESTDERGVWIQFMKADGSLRNALATRTLDHIPAEQHPSGSKDELMAISFYDLFLGDWRSFRADRLIVNC